MRNTSGGSNCSCQALGGNKIKTHSTLACAAALALAATSAATSAPPAKQNPPHIQLGTKPREILLTKITVSDLAKSYEFYTKVIGLKLATSPDLPALKNPKLNDPDPEFIEVPLNFSGSMADPMLLLIKQRGRAPSREAAKLTWIAFKVDDKRQIVRHATEVGYAPFRGGEGDGEATFIADPDGYTVELFQVPSFPSNSGK